MKHMWLNVPGIVPSLGQSREPFRLAGASDPGQIFSEMVEWWPLGALSPFVLRLDSFFTDALA